jgi:hypothetical protein
MMIRKVQKMAEYHVGIGFTGVIHAGTPTKENEC